MMQICAKHGGPIRLGWFTTDEKWALVGKEWRDKHLCLECYLEILDTKAKFWTECAPTRTRYITITHFAKDELRVWFNGLATSSEQFGEYQLSGESQYAVIQGDVLSPEEALK